MLASVPTIFFTGVFAAIAAGYALSTIFDSNLLIIPVALLWGLMIFNLDRFIVSTMKKSGSFWKDFATATPRIILAVLIAIVIAKPLELKIFESEINAELVKMEQEQQKEREDLVNSRYQGDIQLLQADIATLKSEIDTKATGRDELVNEAIMEADGTGGSLQRNLGPIYKTKRLAADNAQSELDELEARNLDLIQSKEVQIASLEDQLATDKNGLENASLKGFAARLEGLERAGKRSQAIMWANLFIMLLFLTIETAPVISKLIIRRSPYDYLLDKHEFQFVVNHKQATSRLQNNVLNEVQFDTATSDYKTKLAIDAEKDLATAAFKQRVEELTGKTKVSRNILKDSAVFGA